MLDFKKKVDVKPLEEIKVANCPVCNAYVCHAYYMVDKSSNKKSRWFSCSCGIIFNAQKPTKVYDQKYWLDNSTYDAKRKTAFEYPIRLYMPIIEELTYGRRVLIIGRPNTYQEEAMEARGWVTTIIDKNTHFKSGGNLIASDFETYSFPESPKYNLIWIYHTLECFSDPVASLTLCSKLLAEDGILSLYGVDTDFINTRSNSCFIHWKYDQNYIMWNKRAITKKMESLGFNTIMCRSNHENRFNMWDDFHGIWQKSFF